MILRAACCLHKKSDKFEISNINDLYSIYPQIRYRKGPGTTSLDIAKFDPILKLLEGFLLVLKILKMQ